MTKLEMFFDAVERQIVINILRVRIIAYCVAKAIVCGLGLVKDWVYYRVVFHNNDKRQEYFAACCDAKRARLVKDMNSFSERVCYQA